MDWNTILRCNLEHEVEADRQQLKEILSRPDDSARIDALRILAGSLGASIIRMYPGYGEASLPETLMPTRRHKSEWKWVALRDQIGGYKSISRGNCAEYS